MSMSRRCIPYSPRRRELSETVFALVTTAGVHLRNQEPFDLAGDNTWRIIPGDVAREMYEEKLLDVNHDLHFYVGTVSGHPNTWTIIGLFYPPPRPTSLTQLTLFGG